LARIAGLKRAYRTASNQIRENSYRPGGIGSRTSGGSETGDASSLRKGMEEAHQKMPNRSIEVARALEDGDLVAVHSRVTRQDPTAPEIAVVHIFRFEGDRIAELWDVGQELPKESPNKNGPF